MKPRILITLCICLVLTGGVAFTRTGAPVVQAQAATVVYNLYATDGYYELPDGQALYMYGFIGGRQNEPFTYQSSCIPGKKDKVTGLRACTGSTNVPIAGGPVAPQGGPWVGQDAQFAGNAQFPAPIIYATTGDVVEIRLKNLGVAANLLAPNDPHSIHLHGLDVDAANDGVPETSLGAVPANLCADGTTNINCAKNGGPATGAGNVIVYMFSPEYAGTYMYHCHQEADIHVQMGMFGALVVYNAGDAAAATGPGQDAGGTLYGVPYDKDYVLLLSEFDVRGHADEEGTYKPAIWDPVPYNWALYKPTYWSINGLSFPQTIHAAFPSGYTFDQWLLAHPGYDPLITGSISGGSGTWPAPDTAGEKVLIRVINMGFETHPMHMHGYHGKVIGSDARGWDWTNQVNGALRPFNEGLEKNTLVTGSGETYDWLVDFGQQAFQAPPYSADTQSRYYNGSAACQGDLNGAGVPLPALNTPVSNTFVNCPVIPDAGIPGIGVPPYIGGPNVAGVVDVVTGLGSPPLDPANNWAAPAVSQYFPFHNHDDYKATNNGIYPGGMFTFIVPTQ